MRLRLGARGVTLGAAERAEVERIVRTALSRHAGRLAAVVVHLLPSPPMHGAGRVCCRIRARRRDGRSWLAEEHAREPREAAAGAGLRLEHRLDLERSLVDSTRSNRALAH